MMPNNLFCGNNQVSQANNNQYRRESLTDIHYDEDATTSQFQMFNLDSEYYKLGLRRIRAPRDGGCLFNSIKVFLEDDNPVRASIVDYMRVELQQYMDENIGDMAHANPNNYLLQAMVSLYDVCWYSEKKRKEVENRTVSDYLNDMSDIGTYGSAAEII
ncbi:hypothetical protein AKO1_000928, partial [Acrasis kona]